MQPGLSPAALCVLTPNLEIHMADKSKLTTTDRMSNTGYHANGKPNWWARVGKGDAAAFLEMYRQAQPCTAVLAKAPIRPCGRP